MDTQALESALQIRYVKLHFKICFLEHTRLPMNKPSALRGGIGEMLLRANCIRDRNCAECDFELECIVRRTMYSKFEEKPAFVTSGESIGYVLECENYEEDFEVGDTLDFNLILFGKTIVYFSQFLQALSQLGNVGLGKAHSRYEIISITNTFGRPILDGRNIDMGNYQIQTVWDYVKYRMEQRTVSENRIRFKTPVTLKYQGKFLQRLSVEAIVQAVLRRIYMLDCFEGFGCESLRWESLYPRILDETSRPYTVYRYSSTQDQKMPLRGIKGDLLLAEIPQDLLLILFAGELIHIGKNTSFGFGRFHIK